MEIKFDDSLDNTMCPGDLGALHELKVCVDLSAKGFQVYRAQSPSAPFDLVAYKNGSLFRVEVKTFSLIGNRPSGKVYASISPPQNDEYDILAVVSKMNLDNRVTYFTSDSTMEEMREILLA